MSDNREKLLKMTVSHVDSGHAEDQWAEAAKLLDELLQDARVKQARADSELMQKMSDRAPDSKPPAGGTNGKRVFASAANVLNPDGLGWSLKLPDHLR
ncbi:hypothetical protein ABT282_07165 [Streptomyces sp. NPDC000927]|uniref:hypothetical protein n=1 Tax=Streptomyces sp. NPDC000927 TaxID=3154371 RepID=UPI00332954EE